MIRIVLAILILMLIFKESYSSNDGIMIHGIRRNYCSRIESYETDTIVPETKVVKETYMVFCLSVTLRCPKHRFKNVTEEKVITTKHTKRVFDCCPGYVKDNDDICNPVCAHACGHGECIGPDTCLCEPGWREPLCDIECEPNRFGRGCIDECMCLNGATCDQETGICHCPAGFTGESCELRCPENMYGENCKNSCECMNDAFCDIETGACDCKPGFVGDYCENQCENGTHGQNCEHECVCIPETTEECHHVDGVCTCKPGFEGEYCEKECDEDHYGQNCGELCDCVHADYCDSTDGECYCKSGWTGERCDEACLLGFWGSNCSNTCECKEKDICDGITGICLWKQLNNSESSDSTVSYGKNDLTLVLGKIGFIVTVLFVVAVIIFWACKKYTNFIDQPFACLFRCMKRTSTENENVPEAFHNPVYDHTNVVLESEQHGDDCVRGSSSGGVRYFRNHINDLNAETASAKVENSNKVPDETEKVKNVTKDTGSRKSQLFNDLNTVFKELKRCSVRKTDLAHSSTAALDEDFQPEILEDFNTPENIYAAVKGTEIESMCNTLVTIEDNTLSGKEEV